MRRRSRTLHRLPYALIPNLGRMLARHPGVHPEFPQVLLEAVRDATGSPLVKSRERAFGRACGFKHRLQVWDLLCLLSRPSQLFEVIEPVRGLSALQE